MKTTTQTQFGDFQTPVDLAFQVTQFLSTNGISPAVVVEPTCGVGNFLVASMRTFGDGIPHYGFDVNPEHVNAAKDALAGQGGGGATSWHARTSTTRTGPLFSASCLVGYSLLGTHLG